MRKTLFSKAILVIVLATITIGSIAYAVTKSNQVKRLESALKYSQATTDARGDHYNRTSRQLADLREALRQCQERVEELEKLETQAVKLDHAE